MGRNDHAHVIDSLATADHMGADGIHGEKYTPAHSVLQTPSDHFQQLFRQNIGHGRTMIAWLPGRAPAWFKVNQERAQEILSRWVGEPDAYITPNCFHEWRLTRLLHSLNSFYVDIDFHGNPDRVDFCREASNVIHKIEMLRWPEPNFLVYTGRGLHVYWLIDPTPAGALPRWQAVQRELVRQLEADRQVTDCTRVLRLVGSTNSKAGNCRVSGELLHTRQYNFDWFCDEVLPLQRAEIRDLRAARANKRRDDYDGKPRGVPGGIFQRWHKVYQDLLRICDYHWFGGVREGFRDHMLFHMANALSYFTVADSFENEIAVLAQTWVPDLSTKQALSYCSSVISRAKAMQLNPDGEELRYKYKRQTLWNQFSEIVPDDLLPSLRSIIPDELAAEREVHRQSKRDRVTEGRYKRKTANRSDVDNQKRTIRRLLSQGHTQAFIGEKLGMDKGRVSRLVKEMKNKAKTGKH